MVRVRRECIDVLLVAFDHLHHLLGSRGVPRVLRVDLPDVALIRAHDELARAREEIDGFDARPGGG